ncbi:MAG TPA: flagellar hook-length control protein FliK [Vicinamibacterales bacterium]
MPAPRIDDTIDVEPSNAQTEQAVSPAVLRVAHASQGHSGGADRGQDQRPGTFAAPHVFWPVAAGPAPDPVASDTFARLTAGSGLPMPSEAELSTVGPQLIRTLHMQVREGGGQVRLTLSPEHLGTVTVDLRVDGRQVTAVLGADTAAVRGWLTAHEQDLRTGLSELGLTLEELVVRDEDTQRERQQAREHERPRAPKRRSGAEPVFEIRV